MIYRVLMDGNDIMDYKDKACALLSPTLNTELNAAGSFEFTMPPGHIFYEDVHPLTSTIEVYEDTELLWFGRPVEIKADFYKQRQVYCEGALAFFNDSVQLLHEYERISLHTFFRTVIANHNEQVASDRQFTVGGITVTDKTVYRKLNYDSTFDVLKRQCLNAEGGYLFVRRENGVNYIDWLAEMPYSCNQPVEFGLNMLDISSDIDCTSYATCVIPLGDTVEETGEPLTVASVNNDSVVIDSDAVSLYGRITKAVSFSGVKDAATLYADGLEYLSSTQFDDLLIECSAAELHRQNANYEIFRLGQMIRVHSVPHLIDKELPLIKLSLRLDPGTVTLDKSAIAAAAEQTTGNVTLRLHRLDETAQALTEAQREAISALTEAMVLDISLENAGKQLSDLKGGTAMVTLPYDLQPGRTAAGVVAQYVAPDGTLTELPTEYRDGSASFSVGHFSIYAVSYSEAHAIRACARDSACPASAFGDLDAGAWYHDGVHWALDHAVMQGVSDGSFDPEGVTSRAMLVTMLWRMEGEPFAYYDLRYRDVPEGEWYTRAVRWAAFTGIVSGYSEAEFGPDDPVTREQLATILYRYAQTKGQGFTGLWAFQLDFDDAGQVSAWAQEALCWMTMRGVIQGTGDNLVSPLSGATRAQVATMLMRYDAVED